MYRTVDSAFWSDPLVVALCPEAKLLALYLITNPHTHLGGIYYLPMSAIEEETGIASRRLNTLCDTLSSSGFARFDKKTKVVWVRNMFRYQGKGEKNDRSVARQLLTLHKSSLINDFLESYPEVKTHLPIGYRIGYPKLDRLGPPVPVPVSVPVSVSSLSSPEEEVTKPTGSAGKAKRFVPPTLEEVAAHCLERRNGIDPEQFIAAYQQSGWKLKSGRSMVDWKAAIVTWEKYRKERAASDNDTDEYRGPTYG